MATEDDGVTFTSPLMPASTTEITVVASDAGYVDAWLDIDGDGVWSEANEKILDSAPVVEGENLVSIELPASTLPGTRLARFRINSTGGLSPFGLAMDGEVEDYAVEVSSRTIFTVTSASDSGPGTLRDAITQANATPNLAGPDVINFDFGTVDPTVISISTALPAITDPVKIDAMEQLNYSGTPLVQLRPLAAIQYAFEVDTVESEIRGFSITGFDQAAIKLGGIADSANNLIASNYLGLDPASAADGNGLGVVIASSQNTIRDNVISGNVGAGVALAATAVGQHDRW